MKRLCATLAVAACLLGMAMPAHAGPRFGPRFYIAARYSESEPITMKLRHDNHFRILQFGQTWDITDVDSGEIVAQYHWAEDERLMAPHQYETWVWDQERGCHGACEEASAGDPVGPGRYRVSTTIDGKEVSKTFGIGVYFHLGFEFHPSADFVVFSNNADTVAQMRAELERPEEERQIVAGIVRQRRAPYNPGWSYVLGERSLFLGEYFIEVCDASPHYVEENLKDWRGGQWCPWSSNVESEGL